jgi:hypothetical protein
MHKTYYIPNTEYLNPPEEYSHSYLYPDFQDKLDNYKTELMRKLQNNIPTSYYKFGDGDYYFLNQIATGSAKPGRRALKKPYSKLDMSPFIDGYLKNDTYASLITSQNITKFNDMFTKPIDVPSEIIYGLIANKWLFENANCKIGLIGAKPKIKIIQNLMRHDQYIDYLKLDSSNDYLYIDQTFACDNLNRTKKKLFNQVEKSDSDLYLLGIGHVKSGLLHELKSIKPAIYLDIGVGIDALAGLVNIYRPYFGKWKNFRLPNSKYLYRNVDILINNFGSLGELINLK